MNATQIRDAILTSDLTAADIRTLTDAIKTVRKRIGQEVINQIAVNQRVKWTFCNATSFGTVQKVSRTTIVVRADHDNQLWRIQASMLQAA